MSDSSQNLLRAIDAYIRPATSPVAIRLSAGSAGRPAKAKQPTAALGHQISICQAVGLARRWGWTMALTEKDQACPVGQVILGFVPPDKLQTGRITTPGYAETLQAASCLENQIPLLPQGETGEIWIEPLAKGNFEPDIVVTYGNPAQIARMIQGANYRTGKGVDSKAFGKSACASYIAYPRLRGECTFIVPSGGERVFAICQDDEMIFSAPAGQFDDLAFGIEQVHKQGLSRFPTPYYGLIAEPAFPQYYKDVLPDVYQK